VATLPNGAPIYLPFMAPGDHVRAHPETKRGEGWAGSADLLAAGAHRATPVCRHFGVCGGCSLQQVDDATYIAWKSSLLTAGLRRAGYDIATAACARTPAHARRRMDLAIRRAGPRIELGLHAARDTAIVDLLACHVLHPELFALIAPLRTLLLGLAALRRDGSAIVNMMDNGADMLLRLDGELNAADRTRLAAFATAHGMPRISTARREAASETACQLRPPTIRFAGVPVIPPPGAFLQASREGEAAILGAVLAAIPAKLTAKSRIAELYAGCGTLTFALAKHARIAAFEGDAAAAAALSNAVNAARLAGRIDVQHRDLARQPILAKQLSTYAAVVLDPPYAGALGQMSEIAASGVARVIYVGCNPATLARDAKLLHQAGYRIAAATPVDQFLWSARLESVVVFDRGGKRG
jgi:23S rRNA (uracil1939-C5)-methyltransferase